MNDTVESGEGPKTSGALNEVVEIIKTVVYALLIALFLRVLFFQPFTIPSASMEPNLYEGDYIIVSKFSYGYSRHSIPFSPNIHQGRVLEQKASRGDIVVFKLPSDGRTDYVKRVIGVSGDRVQMKAGLLYLNDKLVQRDAMSPVKSDLGFGQVVDVARFRERLDGGRTYDTQDMGTDGNLDNGAQFIVPEGYYFMMGDNRDNSSDSRVDPFEGGVGMVPAENLVGKAQIVLLSWHPKASIFKPWTWVLDARPSRFFKILEMNTRVAAIEELERRIGYSFIDRDLLERALTHASVGDGAREVRHNERLEFLGDRVLNLCAAERLMALDPDSREGEMSRRLANLVNYHACARAAHRAGLPDALRLSASATKVGARKSDAVLGDACEALMAALYIDGGLDTAKAFFLQFWGEEFEDIDAPRTKDPKTQLQEWAQGLGLPLPRYEIISREGPAHAPAFVIEVEVQGFSPERGEGGSRQAAEKSAALTMLLKREGVESEPETDQ